MREETGMAEAMRTRRRASAEAEIRRMAEDWAEEAEQLRALVPDFSLEAALADGTFRTLLRAGVPLSRAYFALCADEALRSAMLRAGEAAEKRVTEHIRARGARPAENGLGGGTGLVVQPDVAHMSRSDRARLAERAAHGERVRLLR